MSKQLTQLRLAWVAAITMIILLVGTTVLNQTHADVVKPSTSGWTFLPFTTEASNPVTGWYKVQEGKMYDQQNNVIATEPTWTDCVKSVTVDSSTGIYEDKPESTMPTGEYIWRLWDSASPASTDVCIKSKLIYWDQSKKLITEVADL